MVMQTNGMDDIDGHFNYAFAYKQLVACLYSTKRNNYRITRTVERAFTIA